MLTKILILKKPLHLREQFFRCFNSIDNYSLYKKELKIYKLMTREYADKLKGF